MARKAINAPTALKVTRVAWAALFVSQIGMGVMFGWMVVTAKGIVPEFATISGVISAIGLVIVTPFGLWLRGQYFKSGWQGDAVVPSAYMTGMVLALVLNQAPFFASLVACLFDAKFLPWGIVTAICMVLHVLLWPNGKAMFVHSEAIATTKKAPEAAPEADADAGR